MRKTCWIGVVAEAWYGCWYEYVYADEDDREFGYRDAACAGKCLVGAFVDFGFDIGFFGRKPMGREG